MTARAARPLLYVGVLGVVFGLARAHAEWIGHYDFTGSSRFAWTVIYAVVLSATAYGFGLPDVPRTRRHMLQSSVGAAFVGAAVMSVIQLAVGDALLPRFVVFGSAVLLPDWYRICIRLAAGGRLRAEARDRVALIATDEEADALQAELTALPERPASVIARMTPADAARTGPGEPVLAERLAAIAPSIIVLDRAAHETPAIVDQVSLLHARGVRVRTITMFYEQWLGKLPMWELERASLLFDIGELHRARYSRTKRIIDLPLAVLGGVVLLIVVPFVLVGNAFANRGPLLYRQARIGKGGTEFTIVKFRTMRVAGGNELHNEWTTEDDPRITRFGRFLRRTHLDELPQVVNILRGDLSVVGPRPEQPHYVEELTAKLPFYPLRHLVRPGVTGWAQVNYGYAGDERDALEKLQYDFWYLRHQDLGLDLRILGRTVRSVVGSRGAGR